MKAFVEGFHDYIRWNGEEDWPDTALEPSVWISQAIPSHRVASCMRRCRVSCLKSTSTWQHGQSTCRPPTHFGAFSIKGSCSWCSVWTTRHTPQHVKKEAPGRDRGVGGHVCDPSPCVDSSSFIRCLCSCPEAQYDPRHRTADKDRVQESGSLHECAYGTPHTSISAQVSALMSKTTAMYFVQPCTSWPTGPVPHVS